MKKQAITLGRVGILLPIAVIIPVIGQLAGLAALVLLLISHYNFSKIYEKSVIFKNMLIGAIIPIIGSIIGGIIMAIAVGSAAVSASGMDPDSMGFQQLRSMIFESGIAFVGAIIILAGLIVGYYFVYKALTTLAEETGIKHFKTAGLLYFAGSIGIIIFFLGFIAILVGWILHIVAYFTMQPDNAEVAEAS